MKTRTASNRPSWLFAFAAVLLLGCETQPLRSLSIGSELTAADLVTAFKKLPTCLQSPSTGNNLNLYIDFVRDLQTFSKSEVRSALSDLFDSGNYPPATAEEEAVAYALMRIYFKVPATVARADAKYYGGPSTEIVPGTGPYEVGRPIDENSLGVIVGVNRCGPVVAKGYDAVGEFDYFDQTLALAVRDLSGY